MHFASPHQPMGPIESCGGDRHSARMDTTNKGLSARLDRIPGRWLVMALACLLVIATCQQMQLQSLRSELEDTDDVARDGFNAAEEAKLTAEEAKDAAEEAKRAADEAQEQAENAQQTAEDAQSQAVLNLQ